MKLFGVYLGGMAAGCSIEAHDFVFAIGESIEDTHDYLRKKWFGIPKGLHIDSWVEISTLDGHKIEVSDTNEKSPGDSKVYFVNLGGYKKNYFGECHHDIFLVAKSMAEARSIAKKSILQKFDLPHVDFSYEVDECIEAGGFLDVAIVVTKNEQSFDSIPLEFNSGYFKIQA